MRRHYTLPKQPQDDPEPCTIDAGVVAEYLESRRRPQMAAFVRHLGTAAQRANQAEMRWREAYAQVLEQLHKYEPPPSRAERACNKPDWTCDG